MMDADRHGRSFVGRLASGVKLRTGVL